MVEDDAPSSAVPLCASADLEESGKAVMFDVMLWQKPERAFALRFDGRVVAYMNRCAHVPVEMNWKPGEFLDDSRRYIVCCIHGATYEPSDGLCIQGPCRGERLMNIDVVERSGQVYWYPSPDIAAPAPGDPAPAPASSFAPPSHVR